LNVPATAAGERLDRFLAAHLGSRAAAERAIDAGALVDGVTRPKSFRLEGGEEVLLQDALLRYLAPERTLEILRVDAAFLHFGVQGLDGLEVVLLHHLEDAFVHRGINVLLKADVLGFLDDELLVNEICDQLTLTLVDIFLGLFAAFTLLHIGIDDVLHLPFDTRKGDHTIVHLCDDLVNDLRLGFLCKGCRRESSA